MIEVVQQINAVRRRVGRRTLEAGQARCVIISQVYSAPAGDVWDACTSADRIRRWFVPVTGDLRAGGRYQIEATRAAPSNAAIPRTASRRPGSSAGQASWIEVGMAGEPAGGTRLEIEHIAAPGDGTWTWAEFGPGALGVGWDMGLMGLATYLTSGSSVDPRESAAWLASGPGREFITESSRRWRDADVVAGTDEAAAQAAADRITAAYTGGTVSG